MNDIPHHLGKYQLLERLGYGGMAEVWKAHDSQLQRYVAIKILHADLIDDQDFITRFGREARFIASLHHSNIIQIYDFHVSSPPETPDVLAYMVMEYIEGQTLAQYLQNTSHKNRIPSPANLMRLYTPICLAIDYAHNKGMIHRDIKPPNILLDRRNAINDPVGVPILSDFGIARVLGDVTNSHTGWWLGTPLYISPEQVMGTPANEQSDIYSLSIVLYETCTGVLPFQGDNPAAVMMQHLHAPVVPPMRINPQIPPALSAIIVKGLAKAPESRFPSASALGIAMAEALHMPVPDSLKQMAAQTVEMSSPTHIGPISTRVPLSSQLEFEDVAPVVLPVPSALAASEPGKTPFLGLNPDPMTPFDQPAEELVMYPDIPVSSTPSAQHMPPAFQPALSPPFRAEKRVRRRTIATTL
ncbi:MAG TPA: protein kinase, partial [Ktedonobacteraceae bacterium]